MRLLIGLVVLHLALVVVPAVWADTFVEGLEVQCDRYQLNIKEFDLTNGSPDRAQSVGTKIYHDHGLHKVSCVVNGHKVEAEFQVLQRAEKGECGGANGGLITVIIDNQVIVQDTPHHSCTEGTTSVAVYPEINGYGLELCGHTDLRQTPSFSGCVRVRSDQLAKIRKPLNHTFPVGELLPLVKF